MLKEIFTNPDYLLNFPGINSAGKIIVTLIEFFLTLIKIFEK
jgi:hypothetical protein